MAKKTDLNDQVKIRGIRKRWLLNSIGVVLLILALNFICVGASMVCLHLFSVPTPLIGRA